MQSGLGGLRGCLQDFVLVELLKDLGAQGHLLREGTRVLADVVEVLPTPRALAMVFTTGAVHLSLGGA